MIDFIWRKQAEIKNPVVLPTFFRDAKLFSHSEDFNIRFRKALHILAKSSLITYYKSSDSYSMHPLVHTWVRKRSQIIIRAQAVWYEAALPPFLRYILFPPLNETVDPNGNLARMLLSHFISIVKF